MSRTPEFDQQSVLHNAMMLFWKKGYGMTSVKDLTEVTSLQPGSLYGAFKNKRNLFLNSLDLYFNNLNADVSCILESDETPLKRIRLFFNHLLNQVELDTDKKSCLLLNTLLELPTDDHEISQRVSSMFNTIEKKFEKVLLEAQREGELAAGIRPESMAKVLMSGIFGLQAYNRLQNNNDSLSQIVNNLLSILEK